jgi:hypothetical protein
MDNKYDPENQFPPIEGNNTSIAGPLIVIGIVILITLIVIF